MRVAFLVSGGLGEVVLTYFLSKVNIAFVLTDKASKSIISLCETVNIPVYAGNPRKEEINQFLVGLECDVIASVNYLFIIEKKVINLARDLCFNVHGSLLPKYRGRTPHVWSIINNEKQTGITAHVIDEGCDTGAILHKIHVDIEENDTGATVLEKYKHLYIPLIEQVFSDYKAGILSQTIQDETKATYFGKRTPEDGRINWEWNVERIINWVRAQAFPYPGAFSFYQNTKVTIDKVSKSDYGFHYETENGTILSTSPLLVKCSNAVLCIDKIRESHLVVELNEKFE